MSDEVVYHFLPWVRYGASHLKDPILGKQFQDGQFPVRARMPVKLQLKGHPENPIEIRLSLYGPGDVTGIDPREIVRTEPRPNTVDFVSSYFPFIEFDRPDFPWLFTPGGADADESLLPWIVLVVVRKDLARITFDSQRPLPVLACPRTELPPLSHLKDSWAWAHAQYVGGEDDPLPGVEGALSRQPQKTVSRLLCPRNLKPSTGGKKFEYYACLVPAFEAGRKSGLGEPEGDLDRQLAHWDFNDGQVMLPIYYHWEFSTGEKEDFETLADRLRFFDPTEKASRQMDLSCPGAGMLPNLWQNIDLPSALQPHEELPDDFKWFQDNLRQVLTSPREKVETSSAATPDPIIPPVYGSWQVNQRAAEAGANSALLNDHGAPWLSELNLDPRYRVAAGLGTQVIQHRQEQLVEAAREQVGDLEAVNQWLRQQQLARAVTRSIHENRFDKSSNEALEQITRPVFPMNTTRREVVSMPRMDRASTQNVLHEAMASVSFRKLVRPFGPLARRLGAAIRSTAGPHLKTSPDRDGGSPKGSHPPPCLAQIAPPPGATAGAIKISGYPPDAVSQGSSVGLNRQDLMERIAPYRTFMKEADVRITLTDDRNEAPPQWRAVSNEEIARRAYQLFCEKDGQHGGDREDWLCAEKELYESRALKTLDWSLVFPQPMYEPLRDLFPNFLLPGIDKIPNNSIALLKPNQRFIEAYMVGLNHEFSRELLWREFPAHLKDTFFRQFWDDRGSANPSPDIGEIGLWKNLKENKLGQHMSPHRGENLVMLLIRGDLLARYPNVLIYASRAKFAPDGTPIYDPNEKPRRHILRIDPFPGTTLLGFDLGGPLLTDSNKIPKDDPSWFFVIEEHPTESRFGLDANLPKAFNSWRDLSWLHDGMELENDYLLVKKSKPPKPQENEQDISWGKNGAHMAYITLRKAFSLKIHASVWFEYEK